MVANLNTAKFTPTLTTSTTTPAPSASRNLGNIITSRLGYNILDFGADPTGVNDSVTAIENAMMAAGGGAYGKILVPMGDYALSRSINLDIMNTRAAGNGVINQNEQTSFRFEGEGWTSTRDAQPMTGSTFHAPGTILGTNDYCFKSTANSSGTGNEDNLFSWQGLQFVGYGGIFCSDTSAVIRDCSFITWRGIVFEVCFQTLIENIVIRNFSIGGTVNTRSGGQVGIFVAGDGVIRLVDARQLNQGTGVAVGGNWVLERIHAETSEMGIILGFSPNPAANGGAGNRDYFIGTAKMLTSESNLINVYITDAQFNEMASWDLAGFQSGATQTLCQVYFKAGNFCTFEEINIAGAVSQACLLTGSDGIPSGDGTVAPTMQNNQLVNTYQLTGGPYNAGATVLHLARNKSFQFPQWLVNGIAVRSVDASGNVTGAIPAGATVASVVANDSITLSGGHALTGSMIVGSDGIQFPGSGGVTGAFNPSGGGLDTGYTVTVGLAPF